MIWLRLIISLYLDQKIDEEATNYILNLNPDIIFSFYFRRLIPDEIILKPRLGAYNLHGALLPKYRGQTCINWAVVNGETHTGATLHLMTEKADEGDIVDQRGFDIAFTDTSLDVFIKVSKIASEIIKDCLPKIESGTITLTPQDDTQATKLADVALKMVYWIFLKTPLVYTISFVALHILFLELSPM